jgi:large subunit ribosomal protein L6
MSRIGKQPVPVPSGVKVAINPSTRTINIEGPKGKLSYVWRPEVAVAWNEKESRVLCSISEASMKSGEVRAYWGTTRARIAQMIEGVVKGYQKQLEVVGVGWNAQAQGQSLKLNVGYCNPVELKAPMGVQFKVEGPIVTVTGPDSQAVGQFAAEIRASRPPEPYNGKGVKYVGETIIRKEGKAFGA